MLAAPSRRCAIAIKVNVSVEIDGVPQDRPQAFWTIGPVTQRTTPASRAHRKRKAGHHHPHKEQIRMNLKDDQQVTLSVSATDDQGNPVDGATLGTLSFVSSDESVLTVTDNGDGTALAVTTGTLGSATVTVSDDTDADGAPNFQGSIAIDVVAGDVAAIDVVAGEPTQRP